MQDVIPHPTRNLHTLHGQEMPPSSGVMTLIKSEMP